jgi:hypothetical protein
MTNLYRAVHCLLLNGKKVKVSCGCHLVTSQCRLKKSCVVLWTCQISRLWSNDDNAVTNPRILHVNVSTKQSVKARSTMWGNIQLYDVHTTFNKNPSNRWTSAHLTIDLEVPRSSLEKINCIQNYHISAKISNTKTRYDVEKTLRKVYRFEQGLRSKLSTLEQRIINLQQLTWF